MNIAIVGSGYVGLTTGACFSELGHKVTCVDNDAQKIERLSQGEIPIYEPGLAKIVDKNASAGRLNFSTNLALAARFADAVFIAVGTPSQMDGQANLSYVFNVAREIGTTLKDFAVVVTKSTVPVGTNQRVLEIIQEANPALDFDVASNPEFLKEGSAIRDFMEPDRVVFGVKTDRAAVVLENIYRPLKERGVPVQRVNLETAELIRYASNAFLATKITFINQMAALCESVGGDVRELAVGMGSDSRIGDKFLLAGPGYGGSCFPKDTLAIARTGQEFRSPQSIVEAVIAANDEIKKRMVKKVVELCNGDVANKKIAVFGVTFKADTDDIRDAPSLTILPSLKSLGATLSICDPQGRKYGEALLPEAKWETDPYKTAKDADALVILTEWSDFRELDLSVLARAMASPRLADLRNMFNADDALASGFEAYIGVGVPTNFAAMLNLETAKLSA